MIPKKIHYCWFGGGDKNSKIKKCMATWSILEKAGYEIIEWNDHNFKFEEHPFAKNAYNNREWAFVSDYVRLWAVYTHGGIYLDTDVMIYKNFDPFLKHQAFTGFENNFITFTAVFGAEKNNEWVKNMLSYYDNKKMDDVNFYDDQNYEANVHFITDLMVNKMGFKPNNKYQVIDGVHLYSSSYFCRPSYRNNYATHEFTGTWLKNSRKSKFMESLRKVKILSIISWTIIDYLENKKNRNDIGK